ncbi:hypothetical protein EDC94DRAFT_523543, partial [Helicostylum pulchrum]
EHDNFQVKKMMNSNEIRKTLKTLIDLEIEKSVRGTEYGLLLPTEKDGDEENVSFVKP